MKNLALGFIVQGKKGGEESIMDESIYSMKKK